MTHMSYGWWGTHIGSVVITVKYGEIKSHVHESHVMYDACVSAQAGVKAK